MREELTAIAAEAMSAISEAESGVDLDRVYALYLGKKGKLTDVLKGSRHSLPRNGRESGRKRTC